MSNIEERFFKNNKLERIPKKEKDKIELFNIIIEKFDKNVEYTETEINDILKELYSDYAILRRYMVDYEYLTRDMYGKRYSVIS